MNKGNWEKELDEKMYAYTSKSGMTRESYEELKSFISNLLAQQEKYIKEMEIKMCNIQIQSQKWYAGKYIEECGEQLKHQREELEEELEGKLKTTAEQKVLDKIRIFKFSEFKDIERIEMETSIKFWQEKLKNNE